MALRNSEYKRFPWKEAQALKEEWPEIWKKGGNILGNTQYNRLKPIASRPSSVARTRTEEKAIRLREAWAARHLKDFRLAGVVAQIKWLVVGSRGLSHMRAVISEEKQRLRNKKSFELKSDEQRMAYWKGWLERKVEPIEQGFYRVAMRYLQGAKARYLRRLDGIISAAKSATVDETRAVDWVALLAKDTEARILRDTLGKYWFDSWILTGNDTIEDIYQLLGKDRPPDVRFGDRPIAERSIGALVRQIDETTRKNIKKIVKQGIDEGKSNREIALDLESEAAFRPSRARLIAQTEATSSINRATNQAYVRVQEEEGIKILKQWIASGDDNVRELHKVLGNDATKGIIPADSDFSISGYVGPAPAAFSNAPEMNINCRCTIAPIIIDE